MKSKHHIFYPSAGITSICLALTSCIVPPISVPPPATTPMTSLLTDPAEVLALAGLTLPSGVNDVSIKSKPLTGYPYYYNYTVSWHGTIDTTEQFLAQQNIALDTAWDADDSDRDVLLRDMVIDHIPDGSRMAMNTFRPAKGLGSLNTLVLAPDFTDVYVCLTSFPS